MRTRIIFAVTLLLALGLSACTAAAPQVDWTLTISGAVSSPLELKYVDLAAMSQTDLTDILMEKSTGEDEVTAWSGVPLDEILSKAGAGEYVGITAFAADGYAIEIAKGELQGAIVALKQSGEWISKADPDHGPIRLVCPDTPGNRWVFQLKEIQVNAAAAEPASAIPEDAALKIVGAVENEIGWTEEKIRSMDAIEAESTNKAGETSTYTGVPISDLLAKAGPKVDAVTLVFVADDGYAAEVPLGDVQGCEDCIISFRNQGGFSTVLPGFPGSVQVKGVVEIQVSTEAMEPASAAEPTAAEEAKEPSSTSESAEVVETAGGIPEDAALKITGLVENEIGWTEEAIREMDTIEAESTNKAGETSTYTGVSINDLLGFAGPKGDATTLVLVADDGYTAEVPLADVQGCETCIVSFREQGGFSTVLPGFPGGVQVKGIVEIQVE